MMRQRSAGAVVVISKWMRSLSLGRASQIRAPGHSDRYARFLGWRPDTIGMIHDDLKTGMGQVPHVLLGRH